MRRVASGWIVGLLFGWVFLAGTGSLLAAEPPSEKMLEKRGLKRAGELFVLEAETPVREKAQEVRNLARDWRHARAIQNSTLSESQYQATIKELTNELNQLKAQSNAAQQTMNRLPKMRSRRGGTFFSNNYVTEEYQELNYYKNQLQMEINQRNAFLSQLRSQPFDPKARIRADADAETKKTALQEAVTELRKLVDDAHAKYEVVKKDTEVSKWLQIPEGPAHIKPKLGPSRPFLNDVKLLEQLERQLSPEAPSSKSNHKGHRAKSRRYANTDPASAPF